MASTISHQPIKRRENMPWNLITESFGTGGDTIKHWPCSVTSVTSARRGRCALFLGRSGAKYWPLTPTSDCDSVNTWNKYVTVTLLITTPPTGAATNLNVDSWRHHHRLSHCRHRWRHDVECKRELRWTFSVDFRLDRILIRNIRAIIASFVVSSHSPSRSAPTTTWYGVSTWQPLTTTLQRSLSRSGRTLSPHCWWLRYRMYESMGFSGSDTWRHTMHSDVTSPQVSNEMRGAPVSVESSILIRWKWNVTHAQAKVTCKGNMYCLHNCFLRLCLTWEEGRRVRLSKLQGEGHTFCLRANRTGAVTSAKAEVRLCTPRRWWRAVKTGQDEKPETRLKIFPQVSTHVVSSNESKRIFGAMFPKHFHTTCFRLVRAQRRLTQRPLRLLRLQYES